MVICLERGADLLMAQLMTPPLTVSCFCKIQTHPVVPLKGPLNGCVCVPYLQLDMTVVAYLKDDYKLRDAILTCTQKLT